MNTLDHYREYLKQENYAKSSVKSYLFLADKFIAWLTIENIKGIALDYKTALKYVAYLQKFYNKPATVNHILNSTNCYCNYLVHMASLERNPFTGLRIQGEKRKTVLHDLLSLDELEDIYYSYDTEQDKHPVRILANKRNKVIIGLLVYQGLTTSDLKRLELEHLELSQGKIHIPGGNIGNHRTLELKPWQVIGFLEYVTQVRPELLPKDHPENPYVFIASGGRITDTVAHIIKKLKKINHKVTNIHQIRSSVIVHWLEKYNLRKVQILAGHKRISTTERYQQEDLNQLQEIINTYHPLS
ncbi:MAG: tyrosine-type recombinase/integrase [Flavobacteriaceae bacterium]|nr:MAG: tyrosine-type recombinase/integrase [Flavobacteriaceae bacterium]QMU66156.1 MAG: tyrosine-type recombinase/integrase [Flavobacteriaceae bacterium]QMU66169.1 MAG: tyrosine-type recombinase/integrase [Flavobacteriaceae bacterium]